jgi:hypothetical protein
MAILGNLLGPLNVAKDPYNAKFAQNARLGSPLVGLRSATANGLFGSGGDRSTRPIHL